MPDEPPEFFAERSFGGRRVAELLTEQGWRIRGWLEVYPDPSDQDLADEVWIPRIVDEGWNILTTDDAMRRSSIIRAAIESSAAHVFASSNASLTAEEQADRFHAHRVAIYRRTTIPGPVYCVVRPDGLARQF